MPVLKGRFLMDCRDYRVQSPDRASDDIIDGDIYTPFTEWISVGDRPYFKDRAEEADGEWFTLGVLRQGESRPTAYFFRITRDSTGDLRDVEFCRALSVIADYSVMKDQMQVFHEMANFYGDIRFLIDRTDETVSIEGDPTGIFRKCETLPQFLEVLGTRLTGEERKEFRDVIERLKNGETFASIRIGRNILGNDEDVESTLIRVFLSRLWNGHQAVIGILHGNRAESRYTDVPRDPLTGTVNRMYVEHVARARIDTRHILHTAVAIIDIDHFKDVNDAYGHKRGDEVLCEAAQIMMDEIGSDGVVGRFGGDEFLAVFFDVTDEIRLRTILSNIVYHLRMRLNLSVNGQPVTCTIGCSRYPDDADNYEALFAIADYCLYRGKKKGRNRYIFYNPSAGHAPVQEILERAAMTKGAGRVWDRRGETLGDFLVSIVDRDPEHRNFRVGELLGAFSEKSGISGVSLFYERDGRVQFLSRGAEAFGSDFDAEGFLTLCRNMTPDESRMMVINHLDAIPETRADIRHFLIENEIGALITIRFTFSYGIEAVFALSSRSRVYWDRSRFMYYRLFTRILSGYEVP